MSLEFQLYCECPNCGEEIYTDITFSGHSVYPSGGSEMSEWKEQRCDDCEIDFYFEATINVEVEFERSQLHKPKGFK